MAMPIVQDPSNFLSPDPEMNVLLPFLFPPGYWFQYPKAFNLILPANEGIVLAYLINHHWKVFSNRRNRDRYTEGGWFFCKMEHIIEDLFITRRQQTRMIANLKARGFIKTEKRGFPPKRYFHIEAERIRQRIGKRFRVWEKNNGENETYRRKDEANGDGEENYP
jgi:hypothetical protein